MPEWIVLGQPPSISEFSGKENILLLIVPMVCFSNDMFGYVEGNV